VRIIRVTVPADEGSPGTETLPVEEAKRRAKRLREESEWLEGGGGKFRFDAVGKENRTPNGDQEDLTGGRQNAAIN